MSGPDAPPRTLTVAVERMPLARPFAIARGTKTEAVVVVATVAGGGHVGHGEAVPYPRHGETPEGVAALLATARPAVEAGATRDEVQGLMPAGAARNALDCALWDFDAKRLGLRAWTLAGLHRLAPAVTAYTISLDRPDAMGRSAAAAADRPLLKVKLGSADDEAALAAVRDAAPDSTLIVDANEGWTPEMLPSRFAACRRAGVALIEQPLPAGQDGALADMARPIPVCADESARVAGDLPGLCDRYDVVNVKLDKAGGLTGALAMAAEAERLGLGLMVGCMVGSSLGAAPALLLSPRARFVDLDGPLLLARDRGPGLVYEGSVIHPPEPGVWG